MFYEEWMSYLRDDARIAQIALPGTHNSGTYGMKGMAKCQKDRLYEQYRYGVRYFDIRFHIGITGKLVFEHGVMGGSRLEEGLRDIKRMIENNDSEFFIFKIHYPNVEYLIGKLGRHYKQDFDYVNSIFNEYLEPEKYAFTDFEDISRVTMGDLRKSGKRYILNWDNVGVDYAVNTPVYDPWNPDFYGRHVDDFFDKILSFFPQRPENSIFCLYIQRTPGFGTDVGIKNPITIEKDVKKNFHKLIDTISKNGQLLENVNAMAGDFMTDSHYKSNMILKLNILKGNVKDSYLEEFKKNTAV